jgi:hypothetical protein
MATPTSKVITGGRSVVSITDANGNTQVIGTFDSCSVSESLSVEDIHILGRYSPDEITVTAYNSVKVQCSGFRVYGFGVKALGQFPTLNALLTLGPVTLSVADRLNPSGASMATIINCVPDNNANNFQSRSTSKISISYTGTMMVDESNPNDAESGAVSLP